MGLTTSFTTLKEKRKTKTQEKNNNVSTWYLQNINRRSVKERKSYVSSKSYSSETRNGETRTLTLKHRAVRYFDVVKSMFGHRVTNDLGLFRDDAPAIS